MAIFSEAFRLVPGGLLDPSNPRVIPQPRPVADELALAAALSPLAVADLAVPWDSHLYATDSSEEGAAIVSAPVSPELSALLWRSSDRKDGATKLLSRAQAVLRKIDPLFEEAASVDASPDLGDHERDFVGMPCRAGRPLGLRYHFLQVGSTATALCDALAARGGVVGPILHPAFSPVYDLSSQTFFLWLYRMLDAGKVDAIYLRPSPRTFSPALVPPLRTHREPHGVFRSSSVKLGTRVAHAALGLFIRATALGSPCMLEQPWQSIMYRLPSWARACSKSPSKASLSWVPQSLRWGPPASALQVALLWASCSSPR